MRISDWSSDVCSSDLASMSSPRQHMPVDDDRSSQGELIEAPVQQEGFAVGDPPEHVERAAGEREHADVQHLDDDQGEIGRASCRERVCQYVSLSVVAVSLKQKKQ